MTSPDPTLEEAETLLDLYRAALFVLTRRAGGRLKISVSEVPTEGFTLWRRGDQTEIEFSTEDPSADEIEARGRAIQ